ncbi:hypothetical protein [Metabacillus arenae]|uniref:ECF transporter S component n=1 Tax=Metabacillus arenae TaxID=2771434 RepID=A0A926S2Z2_9BACI|nr:hypothetical protein [Metabacillus arenae]MBD1382459.1 hypothetical protein [Metabacillus arenae]
MEVQTQVHQPKTIQAKHIVSIVISALIFGSMIYITRFLPLKIGTIQLFYPAAIVAPLFGVWFGIWGAAGLVVGNFLSMLLVGLNPLLFPLSLLSQFVMGFIPGLAYRKPHLEKKSDIVRFIFFIILGQVMASLLIALNLLWIQKLPGKVVWGTIWVWMQFSNTLMAAVFTPLLFTWLSGYMRKSGLFFKRFLG